MHLFLPFYNSLFLFLLCTLFLALFIVVVYEYSFLYLYYYLYYYSLPSFFELTFGPNYPFRLFFFLDCSFDGIRSMHLSLNYYLLFILSSLSFFRLSFSLSLFGLSLPFPATFLSLFIFRWLYGFHSVLPTTFDNKEVRSELDFVC